MEALLLVAIAIGKGMHLLVLLVVLHENKWKAEMDT